RHHQRHLLRVAVAALTIEADERAAAANRLVHRHLRIVRQIPQLTYDDAVRLDARVFEQIQLLHRGFSGDAGVREDRQIRRDVGFADGAEDLALVRGDVVPRTDLAEDTDRIRLRLLDERLHDLLLAHRRDLFGIERLGVEAAAGDDRQTRTLRDGFQEVD